MQNWNTICQHQDLLAGVGVCALHQNQQVAIFLSACGNELFAVSNYDPIANANVMSRGLMGSSDSEVYIASPVYKQRYSLSSGQCLDDDEFSLKTFTVRRQEDDVQLMLEPEPTKLTADKELL